MTTSQDPGTLGIYGFRNRADHTYDGLKVANRDGLITAPAVWDPLSRRGGKTIDSLVLCFRQATRRARSTESA